MNKDDCLDPETIAAWLDGGLTDREREAAERHAADCQRCLAVLGAIAKTAPPPVTSPAQSWFGWRLVAPFATAAVAITAWILIQQQSGSPPPPSAPPATVAQQPIDAVAQAEPPPARQERREAAAENRAAQSLQQKAKKQTLARAKDRDESPRSAPAAAETLKETTSVTAASPPVAAPAPPRAEFKDQRQAALRSDAARQADIPSSDPNVRWRIVERSIQRSTDGGRTWQTQNVNAQSDLIAGASPAPDVCWIVGRQGLVLLTIDGATWRRIEFPDTRIDLVGVSARDAVTATITASDGKRYRTVDGGTTWTLQETPATPF